MNRKRKIGILLILIGAGIPFILYFFQNESGILLTQTMHKSVERKLSPSEIQTLESLYSDMLIEEKDTRTQMKEAQAKNLTFSEYMNEYWEKYGKRDLEISQKKKDFIKGLVEKKQFEAHAWTVKSETVISVPYKPSFGIGMLFIFIGFGLLIFSFFPDDKPKKAGGEE